MEKSGFGTKMVTCIAFITAESIVVKIAKAQLFVSITTKCGGAKFVRVPKFVPITGPGTCVRHVAEVKSVNMEMRNIIANYVVGMHIVYMIKGKKIAMNVTEVKSVNMEITKAIAEIVEALRFANIKREFMIV